MPTKRPTAAPATCEATDRLAGHRCELSPNHGPYLTAGCTPARGWDHAAPSKGTFWSTTGGQA